MAPMAFNHGQIARQGCIRRRTRSRGLVGGRRVDVLRGSRVDAGSGIGVGRWDVPRDRNIEAGEGRIGFVGRQSDFGSEVPSRAIFGDSLVEIENDHIAGGVRIGRESF